ncbi:MULTISPECIES: NUDIX domain-containing protein [unclassified Paenibacillus]|uniref:NUDIX domain-containing protein n=1 Tax=Paenibacillus provencensis TaxID=441151 RepID=A0ABW3Q8T1_9BACL|nr:MULTISPECIES: NUDIX domain-containing protein [unclassified Paenibacillus]MCM3129369.1 NUDIX domain-containing protein [Paenibacillus sp. MER 78]SFS72209.1 Isopentenyldiphosphate isomerase [Paenibacillus sp. 453mf]
MSEEMFDIYDPSGTHIGTAPRSEVHQEGYWHKSFHCWLVRDTPEGRTLLFQKRTSSKDTFPSCFDITAAGHLTAGETVREAARELEEELGLRTEFEQLTPLFEVTEEMRGKVSGVPFIDREISHVYGYLSSWELTQYKLQASEVAGLYEADLEQMLNMFLGGLSEVTATGILFHAEEGRYIKVTEHVLPAQFVARPYSYYVSAFKKLQQL